jgi:iduronate 2-sulfatase
MSPRGRDFGFRIWDFGLTILCMNSRLRCLILLVASVLLLPPAPASAERPNVLLICVDDLKPTIGAYGDPVAKTPHLDRLAARSLRLDLAYCNQAVCSPSRNALLTGLRPQTLGIYDLATNFRRARPDATTLPQLFQRHGYRTEALGKILHTGHGNTEDAASWSVPHFRPKAPGYALAENNAPKPESPNAKEPWKDPRGAPTESADVPDETYADGQIAREAARRLAAAAESAESAESGEPFFLAVGFLKPHLPFVAPSRYWDLYDPAALPMPERDRPPEGAPDYAAQFGGELRKYKGIPEGDAALGEELTRHLIHGYYAATSYADAQIGIVLDALESAGLADRTLVVLWGDHGWHLGDHGMWCKHTNYEQAARIPLLVSAPGKAAAVSAALVETVDIYPTLAELAGLPAPVEVEGRSFAALLDDPAAAHRDHAIHVYPRGGRFGRAIRTSRYRLVEWKAFGAAAEEAELELYDYLDDPGETRNLAAERPETVAELRALLAAHPEPRPQLRAATSGDSATAKAKAKDAAPPKDRVAMFRRRDQDGDGRLSLEEFLLNQPDPDEAPARFPRFDADGDGFLSEEEFVRSGKVAKP